MFPLHRFGLALVTLVMFAPRPASAAPGATAKIEYNRNIRPILSENCFPCHGVDSAARKAGLRLDRPEDAVATRKDSAPAIVPGKPEGSALVSRIMATDPDDIMPPPKAHKVLTAEQKELLRRWIAEGAQYQPHWSMIAPVRAKLPPVQNRGWVRNPIDNFILARLEQEGLKPAPEADRRTLARRLSLDLLGLPPSPEEVDSFVRDKAPDAYEKFVERLLASPHWGEHRARYWLDAARYADSNGIHIDNYREMWAYRDWVIEAFNRNEPFDQFTTEQLAGDLLPNRTLEQQVATGFNRCNITTSEGGAIDEEYLVLYARDRTETTSQVWLGLTTGCAVCHDHKFDRVSQKEFYSLSAFFNNTTQKAMDGNVKDTPPIVVVPAAPDFARWQTLPAEKIAAKEKVDKRKETARADFDSWLPSANAEAFSGQAPKDKPALRAALAEETEGSIKVVVGEEERTVALATNASWQEGVVGAKAFTVGSKTVPEIPEGGDFERDQPVSYAAWVRLAETRGGAILARMDDKADYRGWDLWMEDGRPGTHIVSKWPEDALKVVSKKGLESKRWTHVCVTYDGSAKASGVKVYIDGEPQETDVQSDKLKGTIRTKTPMKFGQRSGSSLVDKAGLQDVRFYSRVLKPEEIKGLSGAARLAWLLSKPSEARTESDKDELYKGWLTYLDGNFKQLNEALAQLSKEEAGIKARGSVTHVMQEREEAALAYVLNRGEYTQRKDKVEPGTPAALPPMPKEFPRNRLGFAKWLLLPENPLTARVTVNRYWQEVFGTGIVKTAGDLGVSGEMPSHPELLDWLAVEFREGQWDTKRFFKLLVTSAAYRQSEAVTPEKLAKDPQDRLLSRAPRFRMDAEVIRDYALAASGLLVEKIGGPSVRPYQPDGVWEAIAMKESNTGIYKRDSGENLYRRSLYTFWKRTAPPATMEIFNAPNRETCTVRRERSDTPLQALATLNDTQFVEAARHLAQRALQEGGGNDEARFDFMAQRLLARPFRSEEQKIVRTTLKDLMTHYQAAPQEAEALVAVGESKPDPKLDKPTLAAYTMVANQLMNLDEALNR